MKKVVLVILAVSLVLLPAFTVAFARSQSEIDAINTAATIYQSAATDNETIVMAIGYDATNDIFIINTKMKKMTTANAKNSFYAGTSAYDDVLENAETLYDGTKERFNNAGINVDIAITCTSSSDDLIFAYMNGTDMTEYIVN
jgi:hypothetical protein